jgi:transcriptional regulator with XRE-family HTH domain
MSSTPPAWLLLPAARRAAAEHRYGTLLRLARIAAGLTLEQAGHLAGYSAATLSRIERGLQPLSDMRVLRHLATIFAIPPKAFGLADAPAASSSHRPAIADSLAEGRVGQGGPVRRREFLSVVTGAFAAPLLTANDAAADPSHRLVTSLETILHRPANGAVSINPAALRQGLMAAKADFQASRYRRLAEHLPALLSAATADSSTDPAVLAELYNTATHVLIKLKVGGSGWITAERATAAARASGDPAIIANITRNLATLYRQAGRYDTAETLALDAAEQLSVAGPAASPKHLSLYGMLLCNAAYTAAQAGDRARANELLDHAQQTATRLGGDHNAYWTAFGPTNVISHRISAAIALGDAGTAIDHAATVPPGTIRLPERQSRYWVDVARAYHQWNKPAKCYQALLTAERHAPEEVHSRPIVRTLTTDLLSARRQTGMTGIHELALRVGLPI